MNAKAIASFGVIVGIVGGFIAIDKHYVNKEYHALCEAQVRADMGQMQKQISIQRSYDEVFYWQRSEAQYRVMLNADPANAEIRRLLDEAVREKVKAQDRLRELQK